MKRIGLLVYVVLIIVCIGCGSEYPNSTLDLPEGLPVPCVTDDNLVYTPEYSMQMPKDWEINIYTGEYGGYFTSALYNGELVANLERVETERGYNRNSWIKNYYGADTEILATEEMNHADSAYTLTRVEIKRNSSAAVFEQTGIAYDLYVNYFYELPNGTLYTLEVNNDVADEAIQEFLFTFCSSGKNVGIKSKRKAV